MKKEKYNPWYLLLIIPFALGFTVALLEERFYFAEKAVFDALRLMSPWADLPMKVLTELGSAVGVISMTVVILIASAITKRFMTVGLPVAIASLLSRGVNILLKNIIDRPRPDFKVFAAGESSFPSGHAQNNMALYISLLLVLLLVVTAPKWRITLKITLIALPVIIGVTRLYFGVHYLSDVVAGWSMGALVATFAVWAYFKIYNHLKEKKNAKA